MVIGTLKHNYCVIHKLMEEKEFETYLCKDLNENSQNRYRLIRLKSKELTYKLISIFMELMNNTAFEDYYECFAKDGYLYMVFLHNDNPLLEDKLDSEKCELKERLEIGRKILERIILLNIPDFILYDALSESGITVSNSLEVLFNYNLVNIRRFDVIGIKEVTNKLLHIFGKLFSNELELEASPDIKDFLKDMLEIEYKNYLQIYQKYEVLYEKLSNSDNILSIKPNTLIFRFWNKVKDLAKYIKPILIVIVLVFIVFYLIYSIINRPVDNSAISTFEQIGTVTIEADKEE